MTEGTVSLLVDSVATRGYIWEMKSVGVRELKNRLSEYLREVRSGATVLVTDRGEVVAELSPPGQGQVDASVPPGIADLVKRGRATLGLPNGSSPYKALPRKHPRKVSAAQ